jgi:hypothetical protein
VSRSYHYLACDEAFRAWAYYVWKVMIEDLLFPFLSYTGDPWEGIIAQRILTRKKKRTIMKFPFD